MEEKKEWIQAVFDRAAPDYGGERSAFFGTFGARLVELAKIAPDMHVLDVACGKGAALFPAAKRVGPQGCVTGIDLSAEMVQQTTERAQDEGLSWVDVHQMDAEILSFADATFDVVFCGFALFFFPQLNQALREFRRVLKPGGTLAVTTWGQKPKLSAWVNAEAKRLGATEGLAETFLADEASIRKALTEGGFESIRIHDEQATFWHASPEAWWDSLWEHGTRARLEKLAPEVLQKLQTEALERAEKVKEEKGVPEQFQVYYTFATKG